MNINEMTEMIINLAHMSKRHDGYDHFSLLQYAYFKFKFLNSISPTIYLLINFIN